MSSLALKFTLPYVQLAKEFFSRLPERKSANPTFILHLNSDCTLALVLKSIAVFMKKSLYLETSVVGAYLDNGEPFRRDLTIRWWEHELGDYTAYISPLVVRELERMEEPRRTSYLKLIREMPQLEITEEAAILAEGYVARGIFHRKYLANALHVALASVNKADFIVTWDFGHLANVHRQARIQLFNTIAGFFVPMIVTPEFLINAEI